MRKILLCSFLIGTICCFTACGGSDDYKDTLNSGLEKYYSGEEMNKKEYDAVKSFNKWQDKQGEKKYDAWE